MYGIKLWVVRYICFGMDKPKFRYFKSESEALEFTFSMEHSDMPYAIVKHPDAVLKILQNQLKEDFYRGI